MTNPNLDTAALGAPITRLGIAFFPVYLPGNDLPEIATGDASGLRVDELESASVATLRAINPGDAPVLIVEGEHFLGGKQNRAINTSVLVASRSELPIPVSCLEQGRWGRPQAWRRAESFAPHRIRAAQRASVTASLRQRGSRAGDQGEVWDNVAAMLHEEGVASATMAASDLASAGRRDSDRATAIKGLVERGPLPGQCGVIVAHGRRVTAMELFGAPHLLAAHWERLIRSHCLEAMPAQGRPSANRALSLVRRFGQAPAERLPGLGLGEERRIVAGRMSGQMLTLDGAIVHAAFSREAPVREASHG